MTSVMVLAPGLLPQSLHLFQINKQSGTNDDNDEEYIVAHQFKSKQVKPISFTRLATRIKKLCKKRKSRFIEGGKPVLSICHREKNLGLVKLVLKFVEI